MWLHCIWSPRTSDNSSPGADGRIYRANDPCEALSRPPEYSKGSIITCSPPNRKSREGGKQAILKFVYGRSCEPGVHRAQNCVQKTSLAQGLEHEGL